MSGLQILIIPMALAILAALLTRLRRSGPGNLPPGPPGHDHAGLLEGHRWNTFKSWNDQYGWASSFSQSGGLRFDSQRYRPCGNFLHWATAQHRYISP